MTLITAIRYNEGMILASDSRVIAGNLMMQRNEARKLSALTDKIGVAAAGLTGAIDDIVTAAKSMAPPNSKDFDDVIELFSKLSNEWLKINTERLDDLSGVPVFILVNSGRIRRILPRGYSEEAYGYACEGSGRPYGEYILQNHYKQKMAKNDAVQLAIYVISETSKMDPAVGLPISIMIFPDKGKHEEVSKEKVQEIMEQITPRNIFFESQIFSLTESIVDKRFQINLLFKRKYGFELFGVDEKALFKIMKTCHSEEDFTYHIQALALLIEEINYGSLKVGEGDDDSLKSIGRLSKFLEEHNIDCKEKVIQPLKEIYKIRSANFPVHRTDTESVTLIIKLIGKFPPNWEELWQILLQKFERALSELQNCLSGDATGVNSNGGYSLKG